MFNLYKKFPSANTQCYGALSTCVRVKGKSVDFTKIMKPVDNWDYLASLSSTQKGSEMFNFYKKFQSVNNPNYHMSLPDKRDGFNVIDFYRNLKPGMDTSGNNHTLTSNKYEVGTQLATCPLVSENIENNHHAGGASSNRVIKRKREDDTSHNGLKKLRSSNEHISDPIVAIFSNNKLENRCFKCCKKQYGQVILHQNILHQCICCECAIDVTSGDLQCPICNVVTNKIKKIM